jgi:hypothetical protein
MAPFRLVNNFIFRVSFLNRFHLRKWSSSSPEDLSLSSKHCTLALCYLCVCKYVWFMWYVYIYAYECMCVCTCTCTCGCECNNLMNVDFVIEHLSLQAVFTPNNYAISKCPMPRESTVRLLYLLGGTLIFFWVSLTYRRLCRRSRWFRIS